MKFSWNWLSEFVDLGGIAPETVAERFTLTVAELEAVGKVGQGIDDVVVGRITSVAPHPNADKLRIVEVDVGARVVRGVSGAPNLAVGIVVPVALPGAKLPGGVEVHATDLRGVASELVVLSERELGLSDDHTGVLVLSGDVKLGARFVDVVPVRDTVFEVDNKSLTHRPDLWGHYGLAREVAAMVDRPLRPIDDHVPQTEADPLKVAIDDARDCPRYLAMCYSGVRIEPSPFWLRHRLRTVGLRPISNVVDLTNYVMFALGEPTHGFDRRQLGGDTIRVRRAAEGEHLRTLDGTDLTLSTDDLLIADAARGVALAGVMGGENSEVLPDTTDVVLEAATFHPGLIRRSAVRHGIRTDASARFEKSLDPHLPTHAVAMFTRLLMQICPGSHPASCLYDVGSFDSTPLRIALDPAYVSSRLGVEIEPGRTRRILADLGFDVADVEGGTFDVTVPSWRATRDVSIREDLVEEVGRFIGYDRIEPTPPLAAVELVPRQPRADLSRRVRAILAGACGLDEVITYSFDSQALLRRIGFDPADPLRVRNAISADATMMRSELAPNLLGVVERNASRFADFGVFEIGRVFRATRDAEGIPLQAHHLGLAFQDRGARTAAGVEAMYRKVRGVVEHLLRRLEIADVRVVDDWTNPRVPWMHPAGTARIASGDRTLGYLTRVHPAVMKALDCLGASFVVELGLDTLLAVDHAPVRFAPVPRFPSIQSDVSLIVDDPVPAGGLDALIRREAGALCTDVELVAVYAGAPIPEGRRSLSFRMTFQAPDRTLEAAEVSAAVDRVLAAAKTLGAGLR